MVIRAKARKLSKNKNTYFTNLDAIFFILGLPKVGEPIYLGTDKLFRGGIRTSLVNHIKTAESKKRIRYFVSTLHSLYEITIDKPNLENEIAT